MKHTATLEQIRVEADACRDAAANAAREVLQARLDAAVERLEDERARMIELREERNN